MGSGSSSTQRRKPKIVKGEECWFCPTCQEWVPRNGYYARSRSWNGLGTQCKRCHNEGSVRTRDKVSARKRNREHMARARKKDPEKFRDRERVASRKRPRDEKTEARYQLNLAVRQGEIIRPERCTRCGEKRRVNAHHPDYSRPLFVEWLCSLCHGGKHRDG